MSIPKASKRAERLSRYLKQKIPSRRTVTTLTTSEPSRKTESNPSPAPANTPVECPERAAEPNIPELINEPLNQVLLVDKNSTLADMRSSNYRTWLTMNLIVAIDYGRNVFSVLKNRWGETAKELPLDCLATFLYHPETTDARELNWLRIEHNNQFATRESEQ